MYNLKFLGNEAIFDGISKRILKCPESCKKQIKGSKYWFKRSTQKIHNIPYITISEINKPAGDGISSRIWESLRIDGWR